MQSVTSKSVKSRAGSAHAGMDGAGLQVFVLPQLLSDIL